MTTLDTTRRDLHTLLDAILVLDRHGAKREAEIVRTVANDLSRNVYDADNAMEDISRQTTFTEGMLVEDDGYTSVIDNRDNAWMKAGNQWFSMHPYESGLVVTACTERGAFNVTDHVVRWTIS